MTAPTQKPQDGGFGWVVVAAGFYCCFVVDGVAYCFGVLMKDVAYQFNVPHASSALAGSTLDGCYLTFGIIASGLIDVLGPRKMGVCGVLMTTLAFSLSFFSPNISIFTLLYGFAGGIGFGLTNFAALLLVNFYFESKRSLANGICKSGSSVGAVILAPSVDQVLKIFGLKAVLYFYTGLAASLIICSSVMKYPDLQVQVENNKRKSSISPFSRTDVYLDKSCTSVGDQPERRLSIMHKSLMVYNELDKDHLDKYNQESGLSILRSILARIFNLKLFKNVSFSFYCLFIIFFNLGIYAPYVYTIAMMEERLAGQGHYQLGFIISIISIANGLARIFTGWLADRPRINPLVINTIFTFTAAGALIGLAFSQTIWQCCLFVCLYGFSIGPGISLLSIIMIELLDVENLTSTFGIGTCLSGLATTASAPIAGLIKDYFGDHKAAFFYSAVVLVLASVFNHLSYLATLKMKKQTYTVNDGKKLMPCKHNN